MCSRPNIKGEHMTKLLQAVQRNQLLAALPQDELDRLRPQLEPVSLALRQSLEEPATPIKHVYFLEQGLASIVASTEHHRRIEVGIVGREGVTGMPVIHGADCSPNQTFIQIAGAGLRISAGDLRQAMEESASLRKVLLRYAQAFMVQIAHTALCNGRHRTEERLARWLLMAHDRLDGDEVPLTHEFLSLMLGVRRAGVTVALEMLTKAGLISRSRSRITVLNRGGLQDAAGDSYGVPEAEYRRLMGWNGGL